jgi:thiol-disulfide isomerase/thioredoxin
MTATKTRPRPSAPPAKRLSVVPLAIGAAIVVLAVGLAIALATGSDESPDSDLAAFAPVTVQGTNLTGFTTTEGDPAVGQEAPLLVGETPEGTPIEVGGSSAGEPTLIAFLAHWCPHCQAELPVLVDLEEQGAFEGVRTVAVLTGTDEAAPNFPPAEWLQEEGWGGDVLLDDETMTAATAYGLADYPFLVMLDADGVVVARTSGELPADDVVALVEAASVD